MKKRIGIKFLLLLLVLSTLLSLTSCMAFWVEQIGYDKMFEFAEVEGGYEVKGTPFVAAVMMSKKNFKNMTLEIPGEYNGKPVVAIANEAFKGNVYLNKVIIPDTVKVIGNSAFSDCMTMFECNIPSSVEVIGDAAFMNCPYLDVNIPEGVTTIGAEAFYNTMIWDEEGLFPGAFDFVIDTSAFVRTELNELKIPSTVTSIGEGAFARTTSIVKFDVDENNPMYKSVDGVLYSKDGKNLLHYPLALSNESFTIPDVVENIGNYAFADANNLKSIALAENSRLTRVGNYAFYGCDLLEGITFPETVTSVGDYAVAHCDKLSRCYIGNPNVTLGTRVWEWCTSLNQLDFAGSIEQIIPYVESELLKYEFLSIGKVHCKNGIVLLLSNGTYSIIAVPEIAEINNSDD